ncbi:MFS transporter [Spirillospora sp. NBC_00431]
MTGRPPQPLSARAPIAAEPAPREARRRERLGWYAYDLANSAFPTTVLAVFLGPHLTRVAGSAAGPDGSVDVLGVGVRHEAYYTLVVAVAAVLQAIVLPVAGAVADHTGRKRALLGAFAGLGACATFAMYLVYGERYLLGGALFALGQIGYAAAVVVYNSFLPEIAGPAERDSVSARGMAAGYLGGGVLLAFDLLLFVKHASFGLSEVTAVRIALGSAGLWWGCWTVVPLLWLRDRPAVPAIGSTAEHGARGAARTAAGSLRRLRRTLPELRRYPRTLLFLLAYLVYNSGMQAVLNFAAIYAGHRLALPQEARIGAILMVQFVAVGGALLLARLAGAFGAQRTVLGALAGWTSVVGIAYFLRPGAVVPFLALAAVIGIVMGGAQSLSRSMFSQIIPAGREAEHFSLYELGDKIATFLGALVITVALQATGGYRSAILPLSAFFVAGIALLASVNMRRAINDATSVSGPDPQKVQPTAR